MGTAPVALHCLYVRKGYLARHLIPCCSRRDSLRWATERPVLKLCPASCISSVELSIMVEILVSACPTARGLVIRPRPMTNTTRWSRSPASGGVSNEGPLQTARQTKGGQLFAGQLNSLSDCDISSAGYI